MIESVSYPAALGDWRPGNTKMPFYLELYGETQPYVSAAFTEVIPANSSPDGQPQSQSATPIYEYWWTIGHETIGKHPHRLGVTGWHNDGNLWDQLKDPAAHVTMLFPLGAGWRVKELTATLKYLAPAQESTLQRIDADLQNIQAFTPLLSVGGAAASLVPGGTAVSTLFGALAKLQVGTLPASAAFNWYVEKIVAPYEGPPGPPDVMQGVRWTLPRSVFELLGGRITGSLAVSFVPLQPQHHDEVAPPDPVGSLERRAVHCAAALYADQTHSAPAPEKYLELLVQPRPPQTATAASDGKAAATPTRPS